MDESIQNMVFSADLIKYVMKDQVELDPGTKFGLHVGKSPFRSVFGDAVLVLYAHQTKFKSNLKKMREFVKLPVPQVVRESLIAACDVFQTGYSPEAYINYCGMLVYLLKGYCDKTKNFGVCEAMMGPISCILDAYTLTREFKDQGGWDSLMKYAEKLTRKVETSV